MSNVRKGIILILVVFVLFFNMTNFLKAGGWLDEYLNNSYEGNSGVTKIGFLLKTMQEERYLKDRDAFFEKADELGVEVIFAAANNDETKQEDILRQMINKGAEVVVLQPVNTDTADNLLRIAHNYNVPIVNYDSLITRSQVDIFLTQNSWAVGELQGEAMIQWFNDHKGKIEGNIILLRGQPGDSNAAAFSQGVLDIIEENPGLKLVVDQSHEGWSPELAMATTEKSFRKYDFKIDAVIANNSGMADGAVRALEAMDYIGTDKVFIAGSDADLTNIRYIVQNKQSVEVFKKIKPLAYKSVEVAVKIARNPGKKIQDLFEINRYVDNGEYEIPTIVTPVVIVNKENIMDTVIAEGFHSREDVYGD